MPSTHHRLKLSVVDSNQAPELGTVFAILRADGSYHIPDPSPLRDMKSDARTKVVLGCLEMLAIQGSIAAANAYLTYKRWDREMKQGKAPQRSTVDHQHTVQVVNDLTGRSIKTVDAQPSKKLKD